MDLAFTNMKFIEYTNENLQLKALEKSNRDVLRQFIKGSLSILWVQ